MNSVIVIPSKANLELLYGPPAPTPCQPDMLLMKKMIPDLRERMWGSRHRVNLRAPKTFVSNCLKVSSGLK